MPQLDEENGDSGDRFLNHMDNWIELVMSFNMKLTHMELGPCDGKLYMQACDLLRAHAERLERMIYENGHPNTNGEPPSNPQPEGDRPPSTAP